MVEPFNDKEVSVMRRIKTVRLFPALSVILCVGLAVLLVGSVSAFAAKPAPAVQTPLSPTKIPQFAQALPILDLAGDPGVRVATGTEIDISI
jgi:hypothetical protein